MNIENRDEMLKHSMTVLESVMPLFIAKGMSKEQISNARDIMELCIKYGFDQGCIHGMFKGQLQTCHKLAELMDMKEDG
jgi:hypothetical protein